ncbi:MAG: metallophosphoesterase [Candidatus Aenigmarchaeota archaeon]|nr:metallophosphoesterase [Candidatus Aenigmarchaeota archaeon]
MFVTNYPAMKIGPHLVIADLHLGITRELYERGVRLPSQVQHLAKKLNMLGRETGTTTLVVAGDFKHKVPGISMQEMREIPEFLSLLEFDRIVVVKGNHDGAIEKLISDKKVVVRQSFAAGRYLFTHGHRNVQTKKKRVAIGHNHPHVKFVDAIGASYFQPCWVIGKAKRHTVVMIPAFNELCGAGVVNGSDGFLGPVAKHIDRKTARVYMLDGTYLGRIQDIMVK